MAVTVFFTLVIIDKKGRLTHVLPVSKWDFIIRAVRISSYLPGRIRLYSRKLVGNAELAGKIYAYVASYREIDKVEINIVTGSVLILYRPQALRSNAELARVEQYIMKGEVDYVLCFRIYVGSFYRKGDS